MSATESKVTTLDDENTPAPVVGKAAKGKAAAAPEGAPAEGETMFNVTVHATDGDAGSAAVDMCINGFLYQLPRGVPCRVPQSVVHGLENAVTTTYKVNGNDVTERNIPRFPFSAVPA